MPDDLQSIIQRLLAGNLDDADVQALGIGAAATEAKGQALILESLHQAKPDV